jgi:hypothetical protein
VAHDLVVPQVESEGLRGLLARAQEIRAQLDDLPGVLEQAQALVGDLRLERKQRQVHQQPAHHGAHAAVAQAQQHIGQRAAQELRRLDLGSVLVGVVPHRRTRDVPQLPAAVAQPVGDLYIFAVQEQLGLVAADLLQRLDPEQDAGAGTPRGLARSGVVVLGVLERLLPAFP